MGFENKLFGTGINEIVSMISGHFYSEKCGRGVDVMTARVAAGP